MDVLSWRGNRIFCVVCLAILRINILNIGRNKTFLNLRSTHKGILRLSPRRHPKNKSLLQKTTQ